MTNQLDLTQLSKQHLIELAWILKGTAAVQPVYRELSARPAKVRLKPDDPDWEAKFTCALAQAFSHE